MTASQPVLAPVASRSVRYGPAISTTWGRDVPSAWMTPLSLREGPELAALISMWRDGIEFWNDRVNSVMVSEGASGRQLSRDLRKLILSRTRALSGRAMMDRRPSALGPISLRPSKPSQDQAVLYEQ